MEHWCKYRSLLEVRPLKIISEKVLSSGFQCDYLFLVTYDATKTGVYMKILIMLLCLIAASHAADAYLTASEAEYARCLKAADATCGE